MSETVYPFIFDETSKLEDIFMVHTWQQSFMNSKNIYEYLPSMYQVLGMQKWTKQVTVLKELRAAGKKINA